MTVEIKIGSMKYVYKDNAISLAQSKEDLEELIIKMEKNEKSRLMLNIKKTKVKFTQHLLNL